MLILVIVLVVILFIKYMISQKTSSPPKVPKREITEYDYKTMQLFQTELNNFQNSNEYITKQKIREINSKYLKFYNRMKRFNSDDHDVHTFLKNYQNLSEICQNINDQYISRKRIEYGETLTNIKGLPLDDRQQAAVLSGEKNVRVIAGAGSGKTLTICGKAAVLVKHEMIDPRKILILSFTKASAEDLEKSLKETLPDVTIDSSTFHKLGLSIINEVEQKKNKAEDESLIDFFYNHFLRSLLNGNHPLSNDFFKFITLYLTVPEDINSFSEKEFRERYNPSAYDYETIRGKLYQESMRKPRTAHMTLKRERVRSMEELMIANYLFLNGINYEYESQYPFNRELNLPNELKWKSYKPDFYLTDYNIYLEHFGITKDYKVPWLNKKEEERYLDGIEKKRRIHSLSGTKLIETYSHYNSDGVLIPKLESILQKNGVETGTIHYEDLYNSESIKYSPEVNTFRDLLTTFINLFKSNGEDIEKIDTWISNLKALNYFQKERKRIFLKIVQAALIDYSNYLRSKGIIDFHDMINLAAKIVQNQEFTNPYSHIIVDEFQDIAFSRYHLLNALIKQNDASFFVVGDDWQAIYKFAGSELVLFTEFEKYFGDTDTRKIVKTYRNSQELIDEAGSFVMKNPNQIKKNLKSDKSTIEPIIILETKQQTLDSNMRKIFSDIIDSNENNSIEVLFLYRNKKDLEVVGNISWLKRNEAEISILDPFFQSITITCKTIHSSKGLQADEAIILNMNGSEMSGFPNKRIDDPLLDYVKINNDTYPFSEERRLFYVALTRTKHRTYILSDSKNPSDFILELRKMKSDNILYIEDKENVKKREAKTGIKCPYCKDGYLIRSQSKKNLYTCTFAKCHFKFEDKSFDKKATIYKLCQKCGGYALKYPSKHKKEDYYWCSFCKSYCND